MRVREPIPPTRRSPHPSRRPADRPTRGRRDRAVRLAVVATMFLVAAIVGCASGPLEPDARPTSLVGDHVVAPWGDDRAAGTPDAPLRTLTEAANRARPGDVILLRDGTYDAVDHDTYVTIEIDGTPDDPITIAAYPGEHPTIDGSRHPYHPRTFGDGRSLTNPPLFTLIGDHLIVEDLTFTSSVGRGLFLHGDDNVLRRITTHDHHSDGIHLRGSRNLLEDIHAYDNVSTANGGDSADGIKIMNPTTPGAAVNRDNVIRRAVLHHNSDDGLDIWDSVGTTIEHTIAYANGVGPTGNGNGFKLGCGCPTNPGTTVRYSIAFANRAHNFDANSNGGITLIQNTSWSAGGFGYVLRNDSGSTVPNVARNNLSFEDREGTHLDDRWTVQSDNSWNLGIGDPEFVALEPDDPDFLVLDPASPAVGAGGTLDPASPDPDLGALALGQRVSDLLWTGWYAPGP